MSFETWSWKNHISIVKQTLLFLADNYFLVVGLRLLGCVYGSIIVVYLNFNFFSFLFSNELHVAKDFVIHI